MLKLLVSALPSAIAKLFLNLWFALKPQRIIFDKGILDCFLLLKLGIFAHTAKIAEIIASMIHSDSFLLKPATNTPISFGLDSECNENNFLESDRRSKLVLLELSIVKLT